MSRYGAISFRFTQIFAAIGYLIPVICRVVPGAPGIPVPPALLDILLPVINVSTGLVYPDWTSVLLILGPINALLYGFIGFVVDALFFAR